MINAKVKPLFRRPFDKHPQPGRHSIHVIICYHSFVSQTIFIFIFWCRQRNKKQQYMVLDFELLSIVLRLPQRTVVMYVLILILPLTPVFQLQKNALLTLCSDRILQDIVSPASALCHFQ